MSAITLTRIYNPMDHSDKDHIQWSFRPGDTVANVLDNTGAIISDRETVKFAVSLNGVQVPADQYDSTYLMPGHQLVVVPYLHGGGDGKDIFRMIGMVILAVVASIASIYVQGLAVFAGKLWAGVLSTMVGGAVMLGGSYLINAQLPPALEA